MELDITIEITEEECTQLAGILGCDRANLEESLAPYLSAAAEEYIRMFLGQKVFTRGADIQEYRLFLLIRSAFGNRIPSEQTISNLFQTTSSRSRSLARSVMSKYQYELGAAIEETLKETLDNAQDLGGGEGFQMIIENKNIVDEMNRALAEIDGTLSQMSKLRGSVSTYTLKPASYRALRTHFGMADDG